MMSNIVDSTLHYAGFVDNELNIKSIIFHFKEKRPFIAKPDFCKVTFPIASLCE
jgi:hypothetical protein